MTIERTPNGTYTEIYLDHAATTPLDRDVLQKMLPYFSSVYGNADSTHRFGRKAAAALDEARESVAAAFGVRDGEIFFTSGGTESDNLAVVGAARAAKKRGRTKLLVSAIEHHAVLLPAQRLAKDEGFTLTLVPVDRQGIVDLDFLRREADENTALVAVMAANNELGTLQPVTEAAQIAHGVGALFFTDAVQAAPYMPLKPREICADILSISAHKFYGPKGVGALYVKSGTPIEAIVLGGEQERGLRGGTSDVAGAAGLAAAYEKTLSNMRENNAKIAAAKEAFLREISVYPFVRINGGAGEKSLPSVLNVRFSGAENGTLLRLLDLQGVAASAGAACTGGDTSPSHVLLATGLTESEAKNSVRFSFGRDNTAEEAAFAARLVGKIAQGLIEKIGDNA